MKYDLNDLWRYDMTTNFWTWVSGNDTFNNTEETLDRNIPYPGARSFAAGTLVEGKLFLFGGQVNSNNSVPGMFLH